MPFELTSPAFESGPVIPKKYASDGENVSPPLSWRDEPQGTKSFALLLDSRDPNQVRNHWMIYNMYKTVHELPEHVPPHDTLPEWTHEGISVRQGTNDFDQIGYHGPLPSTTPPHENTFTLYALNCQLHLEPGSRKQDLLAVMEGHILERAELVGIYTA